MDTEKVYRYPRHFSLATELLAAAAVAIALLLLGRDVLRLVWSSYGVDTTLFAMWPWLAEITELIAAPLLPGEPFPLQLLLPSLGWAALALLLALLLCNSMPTLRTSPRGLLVEFAGDWLAIPWEDIRAIKVTESGERYVLLAETRAGRLTGWHRLYSTIYHLRLTPGFLVTSQISEFNELVKTLLGETDRAARALDNIKPAELQEHASSPLFRLLLNPAAFFAQRGAPQPAAEAETPRGLEDIVRSSYPARITWLLRGTATLIAGLALLRYIVLVMTWLALTFEGLRGLPLFDRLDLRLLPAPWWLLVEAHVLLVVMLGVASTLANLLPAIEARPEGLAVRYDRRWQLVPWSKLFAVKVTEFSETSQVVLVQSEGGLPLAARLVSLIYDGSLRPGVLLTSAISGFEPLLQRIVLEVMRNPPEHTSDAPIFQSEARSDLLWLSLQSGAAIDQLVEESRADAEMQQLRPARLQRAAPPMIALAAAPALILFCDRAFSQHVLPDGRLLIAVLVLFLLALLEWPVVSLASIALDELGDGGEEGSRAFYLYPPVQLPRLLPMLSALAAVLLGAQPIGVLLWIAAIGWSFWLAAGLWSELYDWRGSQLVSGGMVPVVFQLVLLIGYLVVRV